MKILFVDQNKSLCQLVRQSVKGLKRKVRVYNGNIFKHKGVIVSASNPSFLMAGGLDAQIAKRYPTECKEAQLTRGNKRIGDIVFAVTVDKNIQARANLVRNALRAAFKFTKPKETVLLSGLGTGIGGLDKKLFCKILVEEVSKHKSWKWEKRVKTAIKASKGQFLWKFMRTGVVSDHGGMKWKIGRWEHVDGTIKACERGFHGSETILQALGYVKGEVLAQVEVKGESDIEFDKQAWSDMRVVRAYHWEKEDSVALAIFGAEQVLSIYEKKYPGDDRPRKAIEAAKKWLAKPSAYAAAYAAARAAARAADAAADAARAAARAADAAADAARAAARAADAAAYAADAAAYAAARAAAHAAYARQELIDKVNDWLINHIKTLKEIK